MTTLTVQGLHKTYTLRNGLNFTTLEAVKDVDLDLRPGRTVALVGQSGSGKSTIAKILAQLEKPTSGTITLDGEPIGTRGKALAYYRDHVQMVFQDPFASLNPFHTIGHHLERPLLLHRKATRATLRAKVCELLERVNLTPASRYIDRYPTDLSGGQRQRVAIAKSLAVSPKVLLADEPTSMLDASIRLEVLNLLSDLRESEDLAVLYITHDIASARYVSDEILVMYRGEVVERGPADQVILDPQAEFTKQLLVAAPEPGNNPRFLAEARRRGVPMPDHLAPAEETS